MKRTILTALAFVVVAANAHAARVVDVSPINGGYVMFDDTGMFRSFTTDGILVESGWYVPAFEGYKLRDTTGDRGIVHRGNSVARRQLREALDYHCRGDSGDDPKTQRACQLRDELEY